MLQVSQLLYLSAAVCFILSLRGLSSAKTARAGNLLGMCGMLIAVTIALFLSRHHWLALIAIALGGGIGAIIAQKIKMTALPQLVAAFHSLIGLAAVLISWVILRAPHVFNLNIRTSLLFEIGLEAAIGAITFTGSIVAFCKLQGLCKSIKLPILVNASLGAACVVLLGLLTVNGSWISYLLLVLSALVLGSSLILPIGGSDMPVVVSLLNSYSGWTTAATGFTLGNHLLIITGAIVGSSGAILSYIMCKNMNRSILKVIFGQMVSQSQTQEDSSKPAKIGTPEDAAFVLKNASSVIIVPGYGMAVAQAQRALSDVSSILSTNNISVRYAIHPVAGRMPGHMNVLLAEANIPYEDVFELDEINSDFATTDVALVIGANDVTNPAAYNDPKSPIFGMPVLRVEKAGTVLFVKRSLGTGYAGIDNELFYNDNTMMIIGDARKVCENIAKELGISNKSRNGA
jgi:NAD(P) transhydrogenase subunit beta